MEVEDKGEGEDWEEMPGGDREREGRIYAYCETGDWASLNTVGLVFWDKIFVEIFHCFLFSDNFPP